MNEAELLLTQLLGCHRHELYLNKSIRISKEQSLYLAHTLKRRLLGEPIQYILSKVEFMGLEFNISRHVLIPRPETEILVETAIKYMLANRKSAVKAGILDLGTGSGCIAVSLAKLLKNAEIIATDISREALELARKNARLHNVDIRFIQSDLFSSPELGAMSYELIVCNPPYVASEEIRELDPEIQYEPVLALDGGKDGLAFYRRIINKAAFYLDSQGLLIMEIGLGQASPVRDLLEESGDLNLVEFVKDYNGIDRIVVIRKG